MPLSAAARMAPMQSEFRDGGGESAAAVAATRLGGRQGRPTEAQRAGVTTGEQSKKGIVVAAKALLWYGGTSEGGVAEASSQEMIGTRSAEEAALTAHLM